MSLKLREWLITIVVFIIALYLFSLFSYFGIEHFIKDGAIKDYFDSNVWHLEVLLSAIVLGTLFILIDQLTEKKIFRRKSFGFNIILKSVLYFLALVIACVLIYHSFSFFELVSKEQLDIMQSLVNTKFLLSGLIYYAAFILLLNFTLYINKKLGPGSLIDLLTGKYYQPKNEELVFLFLDLKGSTRIAEKLDHKNYSRFLKECIHELTPVVQKYKARIYQYVGDEVVLYWTFNDGLKQLNCINLFFDFIEVLSKRQDYFNEKYGEIPQFKAGMAAGIVTLTEIGDIKREIAFHGDVLNTAARLEKKCNEFNEKLIISQHVVDQISSKHEYSFKFLSDLALKGKSENIKFYAVNLS